MVIATDLDNNARCHILDHLHLIKQFIRNTIQKAHSRNQVDILQGNESIVQSHVASSNPRSSESGVDKKTATWHSCDTLNVNLSSWSNISSMLRARAVGRMMLYPIFISVTLCLLARLGVVMITSTPVLWPFS